MLNTYVLFVISLLIFFTSGLNSKIPKCKCQGKDLCSAIQNHPYVIEAKVKKVLQKQNTLQYRIQVISTIKGQTKKTELISVNPDDPCPQEKLKKRETYLLFLERQNETLWLSSCFNSLSSTEAKNRFKNCSENGTCPQLTCSICENGHVLDKDGCPTCECNQCPNGEPPFECLVQPCSFQSTQCPEADSCVDDFCGGCNARYYDPIGQEICIGCPEISCSVECEHGFKNDQNDCQTCQCNECPNGEIWSDCLVQPCTLQSSECPQASSCVDDYCGGCTAHYFDESGNEICTCPGLVCDLPCEYGYQKDDKGCEICLCNGCPYEEPYEDCPVQPCSRQSIECPQADWCVDDYCECSAHYFDDFGNETCIGCRNPNCSIACEYGYKTDRRGCPICECLVPECSDGGTPVICESNPCSIPTDCPGASTCIPNYCGGCHAFYYDAQGEPFDCSLN